MDGHAASWNCAYMKLSGQVARVAGPRCDTIYANISGASIQDWEGRADAT